VNSIRTLVRSVPLSTALAASALAQPAAPIRALVLTGQNNHNWQFTSRVHEDTLEGTGRFDVDITDNPAQALANAEAIKKYQVFVVDYNGPRWGTQAETNFMNAVKGGTGAVIIHAANNAFVGWPEYETLCGLMWINGKTGHGKFHEFDVKVVDKDHAITKGMADLKAHPDELYHNLINTQNAKYTLLAKAMSSTESGGTGRDEPMALTLSVDQGRIFHTPLGHVWTGVDSSKVSVLDPQFRILLARGTEWAATGAVTLGTQWKDVRRHNMLTDAEKAEGWRLLFDGSSTASWRGYKQEKFPTAGWVVKEGVLTLAGKGGGDIVTADEFGDFEFACEWRVPSGGNSGIMYRSTEDHSYPWETGPEYQILDDAGHADGKKPKTRAGTLYDVFALSFDTARPAGDWNSSRIVARGTRIQHWLNGFKVVDVDTASPEYKQALAQSKWTKYPDYGTKARGHIALQDHGDEVQFRDIKVRDLSGK
jgi:type 1 glutamine amidotransferase